MTTLTIKKILFDRRELIEIPRDEIEGSTLKLLDIIKQLEHCSVKEGEEVISVTVVEPGVISKTIDLIGIAIFCTVLVLLGALPYLG